MFSTLANKLSLLRMILAPVFFVMVISDDPMVRLLALPVFLIAAITDWYDGEIARRSGTVTNAGKFLDPLADKFLTSAAFLGFAVLGYVEWWMVIVIVFRDLLITVLRSIAEIRNMHIATSKAAQWKTFIQMVVLYYLLLLIVLRDVVWIHELFGDLIGVLLHPTVVYILMIIVTLMTIVTGVQYLYSNRKMLSAVFPGTSGVAE